MSCSKDPSGDPIESAAKGAVKGALEWTEEKVVELIKRFKDRDLYFVQDAKIIDLAKELREKGEFKFFKKYVKDKDYRILFMMGLTLRTLEEEGKDFGPLVIKIHKRYGRDGANIAHFVENGLFSKYVGHLLEIISSEEELKEEIEYAFENINNVVAFISQKDKPKQKADEIVTKIQAHSPEIFIISSVGVAKSNCEKVKKMVMQKISSIYKCEFYESRGKKIFFLNRTDIGVL